MEIRLTMTITTHHGDCLDWLPTLSNGSVDMVLADLPFQVTHAEWDVAIPLAPLWAQLRRVSKPNAAIVMFATQPYATDLIVAARDIFRYDLVWEKTMAVGAINAHKMPTRAHELILVFAGGLTTYNPQFGKGDPYRKRRYNHSGGVYGDDSRLGVTEYGAMRWPTSIITKNNQEANNHNAQKLHPTQKPVDLLAYLIRTYSNVGDTILDPTMGSGSTAVACIATGRNFVGCEKDAHFYDVAQRRIAEAEAQPPLIPEAYTPIKQGEQTTIEWSR